MKIPYNWLAEFVDLPDSAEKIGERLSLSGLECAGVSRALPDIDQIVVGEVLAVEPHPDADKLTVCRVDAGTGETLQIVCGAPNVHEGMKAPVILPGGTLPDGTEIRRAKLRGVESAGMLCSARELGLGDDHTGLLALDPGAKTGQPIVEALGGNEPVIEIEITPNRGDALSVLGVARDLAAILDSELRPPAAEPVPAVTDETFPVVLEAPEGGPVFAGRVIRGIDPEARTPLWMRERLRRAGIRPVSLVVDVTQYVMLELGQPMHAYDLSRLKERIQVRWARPGETVKLLDGSTPKLDDDVLVIADESGAIGLAGIMGGEATSVQVGTRDIFLESAFFLPTAIQERPRRLDLMTDAGYRFERGVDPTGQARAIERATRLILEIAGGQPGPTQVTHAESHVPKRTAVFLRRDRIALLLGIAVPDADVQRILTALDMLVEQAEGGWQVTPPAHRFDIAIEEDLIEEVGRIYGYDRIPVRQYPNALGMTPVPEAKVPLRRLKEILVQRGYQEVITYSFVGEAIQRSLVGQAGPALANPVTLEMSHMRASLWPGLVEVLRYNRNRQRDRIRIFETGLRFISQADELKQEMVIAGLVFGPLYPEQWATSDESADFHDLKNDLEALAAQSAGVFRAAAEQHPALHPGQSARLTLNGQPLGWAGRIHPEKSVALEIPQDVLLFEMALEPLQRATVPSFREFSRFPSVRRDLALVVPEELPAAKLKETAMEAAGEVLREVILFDLYQDKGLEFGTKSIAMGLIFQKLSSTLKDEEVDALINRTVQQLEKACDARLRE